MIALGSLLDLPGLSGELDRVEGELRRSVESDDAFLSEVAGHLLRAGGKRLRPALAVGAGLVGTTPSSPAGDDVIRGGAAVELVHLGSLYHDDVMDSADTRRTVETVNHRWGTFVAILGGDFLLARASELAASLGTEVSAVLAATIASLCEGQVRELRHAFDVERTEEAYVAAIAGKTASLFAASCRIGALAANLPRHAVDALTAYGQQVGMAFQIVDDVLDVVATDAQLGKPAGNDLATGVYTLPVIRALAQAESGAALRGLLGRPLDSKALDGARDVVRGNGAVPAACAVARRYAEGAVAALAPLGDGAVVEALARLGHHLVDAVSEVGQSGVRVG